MVARTPAGTAVSVPFRTAPTKARKIRNGFAIHAYTGSNGGGKTLAAVYDSLPALAAGRPIVSTCRILDPLTGEPHPLWVPLDDPRLLLELSYCDAILDEVTGVASSRDSAGMPSAVLNHLQQLRKGDTTVRWTTPNWKRADTAIREVTQGITTCVGVVKSEKTVVSEDGLVRQWKQRKGFVWRTYDAKNFDEWSTTKERSPSKQHRIRAEARQFIWGPGLLAREMYDTYEHAIAWAHVTEHGMCMNCGGKRSVPKCICHDDRLDDRMPDVHDGVCVACDRKRRVSPTCDCAPVEQVATPGMLRWREVDAGRRRKAPEEFPVTADQLHDETEDLAAVSVLFPETDDTPAVVVEPALI